MQTVILAAGQGKRLRPLTLEKPKPLVEVNGRSLLEYNMDQLVGLVDEIVIVIGYKGEKIKEKFSNSYKGIKLKYVEQKKQLGTGHALLQAKKFVKGKFLVLSGDDLYSKKDIKNCLKYDLCVLSQKVDNPERFGIIKLKGDKICDIIEKPKKFVGNLANVGLYVFNEEIFDEIKKIGKSERGEYELIDAIKNLSHKKEIKCVKVRDYYMPIAYPEDLKKASKILKGL